MRNVLVLVMLILLAQAGEATTYSARALDPEEARRWGISIVAFRTSGLESIITIGLNAANFSRCRVSYVTILIRDKDGYLVQAIRPSKLGREYYVNLDEEILGNSEIDLKCEPKRATQPGEQYTIKLSRFVRAT